MCKINNNKQQMKYNIGISEATVDSTVQRDGGGIM